MNDPSCALGINLHGRRVVFAGAGPMTEQKLFRLLDFGANLVVISPECTREIEKLAECGQVVLERREAEPSDFAGTFLAFLATGSDADASLASAARHHGALVNRADDPQDCDVVLPALTWMNTVHIAVFSDSPALSKWVRRHLEHTLGAEFAEFISVFAKIRDKIRQQPLPPATRAELLSRLLNEGLYETYRRDGIAAAIARADALVKEYQKPD